MSSKKLSPEACFLINHVGEFIDYWGFKSIEGKIWCLTYISEQPLGPADYIEAFDISKGLVSQSVKRLIEYDVLIEVSEPGKKKQFYTANRDLIKVIKNVLRKREKRILTDVEASAKDLINIDKSQLKDQGMNEQRIEEVIKLTQTAKSLLEMFIFDDKNIL